MPLTETCYTTPAYGYGSPCIVNVPGTSGNQGTNNGNGWGTDGGWSWWIIILFLFLFNGNRWGDNNGNGGNGSVTPYILNNGTNADIQRGFDQQALVSGLGNLSTAVTNGFSNAEVSRCNQQSNILQTLNANQNATTAGMNQLASTLQQCCCDNRAATADLKYTIATESCADRAAVKDGTNDIIQTGNANTQALINAVNSGNQALMDKLCQFELNAKDQQISELQRQVTQFQNQQYITAQTASILANNSAQTADLKHYLNPPAIPAYVVPNPNCCNYGYTNGCSNNGCCNNSGNYNTGCC